MHSTHSLPAGGDIHAKDYKVQLSVHGEELDSKIVIEDVSRGFFAFSAFYKLTLLVLAVVFIVGLVVFPTTVVSMKVLLKRVEALAENQSMPRTAIRITQISVKMLRMPIPRIPQLPPKTSVSPSRRFFPQTPFTFSRIFPATYRNFLHLTRSKELNLNQNSPTKKYWK